MTEAPDVPVKRQVPPAPQFPVEPQLAQPVSRAAQAFSPEDMARRKRRSIALALVLAGLVVFFFVVTLVKTGPAIMNRPL